MSEFKIEGLPELLKKLEALPEKANQKVLRTAVFRAGQKLRDAIRAAAPVGEHSAIYNKKTGERRMPGFLKKSITAKRSRSRRGEVATKVSVNAFYGRFVETGTEKMGAKPFVTPVYNSLKDSLADEIVQAAFEGVEKLAGDK